MNHHVVLITRHPDGCFLINDAFAKEQGDVADQAERATGLMNLFGEVEKSEIPIKVRDALVAAGKTKPDTTWVFKSLLLAAIAPHFGTYSQTEYYRATRLLLELTSGPRFVAVSGTKLRNGKWKVDDNLRLRFAV